MTFSDEWFDYRYGNVCSRTTASGTCFAMLDDRGSCPVHGEKVRDVYGGLFFMVDRGPTLLGSRLSDGLEVPTSSDGHLHAFGLAIDPGSVEPLHMDPLPGRFDPFGLQPREPTLVEATEKLHDAVAALRRALWRDVAATVVPDEAVRLPLGVCVSRPRVCVPRLREKLMSGYEHARWRLWRDGTV